MENKWCGGNRKKHVMMTPDCCKRMLMMTGTAQSSMVRMYFLTCERIIANQINNDQMSMGSFSELRQKDKNSTKNMSQRLASLLPKNNKRKFGGTFAQVNGGFNKACSGWTKTETRNVLIDKENIDPRGENKKRKWTPRDYMTTIQSRSLELMNLLLEADLEDTDANSPKEVINLSKKIASDVGQALKNRNQHGKYSLENARELGAIPPVASALPTTENQSTIEEGIPGVKTKKKKKRKRRKYEKKSIVSNNPITIYFKPTNNYYNK